MKQKDICEEFKVNKGTCSKIINKFKKQGNVDNNFQNRRRQSILSLYPYIKEEIEHALQQKKSSTISQVQAKLNSQNFDISKSSVYRIMKQKEYNYVKVKFKHQLTDKNKEERVEFCKIWRTRSQASIWYSDESVFELEKDFGYIWSQQGSSSHIFSRKQNSYYNRQVHVWGAASIEGRSRLYFHEKTVDSEEYIKCIEESFFPAAKFYRIANKFSDTFFFFKILTTFLIENVWSQIKDQLYKESFVEESTDEDMFDKAEEAFYSKECTQLIQTLYKSLEDRIQLIIYGEGQQISITKINNNRMIEE
ncbi:hypothetical protein ABPG72_013989 [Tetrahymena utriculariae]